MTIYHLIWLSLVVTAQLFVTVSSTAKQLTCFDIEDQPPIFSGNTQIGPPGKMGPPGAKGDPGRDGSVDYHVLEAMIDKLVNAKMEQRLANVEASIKEMGLNLTILKQQVDRIPKYQGRCDLQYNDTCYWAFVHDVQDVKYKDAQSLCEQDGGFPASIKSVKHEAAVGHYIHSTGARKVFIWTGMRVNQKGQVQSVRKPGTPVYPTKIRQYSRWPVTVKGESRIRLRKAQSYPRIETEAAPLEYSFHGVICEEP